MFILMDEDLLEFSPRTRCPGRAEDGSLLPRGSVNTKLKSSKYRNLWRREAQQMCVRNAAISSLRTGTNWTPTSISSWSVFPLLPNTLKTNERNTAIARAAGTRKLNLKKHVHKIASFGIPDELVVSEFSIPTFQF